MTKPSKSLDRNTFQVNNYIDRCFAEGREPSPEYLKLYENVNERDEKWANQENHDNDMEWDLRTTDWILEKVRTSDTYAQNLYAAICNNEFQKIAVFPILADQSCSYSWRYAGGIIADMREKGDYIDWYCSGIGDGLGNGDGDGTKGYVAESVVTEEIYEDLERLGWRVLDQQDDE